MACIIITDAIELGECNASPLNVHPSIAGAKASKVYPCESLVKNASFSHIFSSPNRLQGSLTAE